MRRPSTLPVLIGVVACAVAGVVFTVDTRAAGDPRVLQAVAGASADCTASVEALNGRLSSGPSPLEVTAAASQLVDGACVRHDEALAAQLFAEAARHGHAAAARRLAALFGTGNGLPQSYANAGAWIVGKGGSDDALEPWDYSVGVAFTLIGETLDRLRLPRDAWPGDAPLRILVDAEARQTGRVSWRPVGNSLDKDGVAGRALSVAVATAAREATARLAPAQPEYLVPARVSVPVILVRGNARDNAEHPVVITEEPLLR